MVIFFTQESDLVITQTDGSIAETILYVRFTPSTEQAKVYDGDIRNIVVMRQQLEAWLLVVKKVKKEE